MVARKLSPNSIDRYRAVISAAQAACQEGVRIATVGLLDRKNEGRLAALDLGSGELRPSEFESFDVVVVDRSTTTSSGEPDFPAIKGRLTPGGIILLRRRSWLARWVGRLLSRRADDADGGPFGRGHDRREAALRRSSLYIAPLEVVSGSRNEPWLMASTAPVVDTLFRDQIGRVATDYLRTVGPIIASGNLLGI